MNNTTILLDMDGVFMDFTTASLQALSDAGFPEALQYSRHASVPRRWPEGVWETWTLAPGCTEKDFWEAVSSYEFWTRVLPYNEDAVAWVRALRSKYNVVFASVPTFGSGAVRAKVEFLERMFPGAEYMLGRRKELLSVSGTILIDDNPRTCAEFTARGGGHAILFPAPWNHLACARRDYWVLDDARRIVDTALVSWLTRFDGRKGKDDDVSA